MSDHPPVPPGSLPGGGPPAEYPSGPPLAPPLSPVPPGAIRPPVAWSTAPAPSPTPPRRPTWVVAVAIVTVLGLLGLLAATVVGDDDGAPGDGGVALEPVPDDGDEDDPSRPPETSAPTTPTTVPATVEEAVADIEAFVAAERGLPFQRDVTVELADDEEFERRLLADFDEDAADIALAGRVLEAVGLLEPGTDVVASFRTLLGAGVVGFYDTETDELVVRGTSPTPYVRTVIAHELTHALDDQHFELFRPDLDELDDESGFGFGALVEGDARRVEDAYRATFTDEEQEQAIAEELDITSGFDIFSVPAILVQNLSLPYLLGPVLVERILDDDGQARLDAAFALPPSTSEHVLDPGTYLAGEGPVEVEAPAADGEVVDAGVLGAVGIGSLVAPSPFSIPGFGAELDAAVEGWGGDRYVAWSDPDGSGTCLRATIVGDTPDDTAELRDALVEWAADGPTTSGIEATVVGGDDGAPLTLTSCSA